MDHLQPQKYLSQPLAIWRTSWRKIPPTSPWPCQTFGFTLPPVLLWGQVGCCRTSPVNLTGSHGFRAMVFNLGFRRTICLQITIEHSRAPRQKFQKLMMWTYPETHKGWPKLSGDYQVPCHITDRQRPWRTCYRTKIPNFNTVPTHGQASQSIQTLASSHLKNH